jgi:hypothetical protein
VLRFDQDRWRDFISAVHVNNIIRAMITTCAPSLRQPIACRALIPALGCAGVDELMDFSRFIADPAAEARLESLERL